MTLEYIATSQLWQGEPISGVRHPLNIEQLWTAPELAAIGLRVRTVSPPPGPTLAAAKADKIAAAWSEHEARFAASVVNVTVNGESRPYGCDPVTRENMIAIVNAITAVPAAVPNPRPFTPKGATSPVLTTHDEFKSIYLAGLAKGDEFYVAYATHKTAINALTTVAAVQTYDIATGWPA